MGNTQKLISHKASYYKEVSNNIVNFLDKPKNRAVKENQLIPDENKVIMLFIISFIYLFSALEEADWNVLSASNNDQEIVVDRSGWNLSSIINLLKSRIKTTS
ncbi:hypothetical protein [Prochlorococcus sp. MIT 1223]|uniref:hypothetical protein n=1 Tax=Prochlorococcus sp. MIT 1223 TaxID=3096217 RepID=UPI002A7532CB|nr:hypothetical protein [Prochlorococcus sp. MIT 1223]